MGWSIEAPDAHPDPPLLHEIIHAICFQMGVDGAINKREGEERWVQALATGLLAVMRENRSLVTYLRSKS